MSLPHPRLAEVFAAAAGAASEARAAILEVKCAGDEDLRRQVERLLAHDEPRTGSGFVLDGPPIASAGALVAALASGEGIDEPGYEPGTVIDKYTIVRPVGAGGFGVVYLARQAAPEERWVALKIMEGLPISRRAPRRFEEERRALARMDHPSVARIYGGGVTGRGHPYFAMEFIAGDGPDAAGPRITGYADAHRLSVRERVEMFIPVCLAVEHAHQQGIIHRDLKPSNILVAEVDAKAVPKIIDFGIARPAAGAEGSSRTLLTLRDELLGTPAYMSPEQAARAPLDTRTDVYSLGVVLYELLCGRCPFPFDERSGPIDEHLRAIRETEPTRPSTAALKTGARDGGIAEARSTDVPRLARALRGDLDTILLKALEKEPSRRYQSAGALADDLRRYLGSEPIKARRATALYTGQKFACRHKLAVAAAALVVASLLAATAISLRARNEAQFHAMVSDVLASSAALAQDNAASGQPRLLRVPTRRRGWEWHHLRYRWDRSVGAYTGHIAPVASLALHPNGRLLLSGARDGAVRGWDSTSGRPLPWSVQLPQAAHGADVWSIAWSPDGTRFATGSFDGTARIWSAQDGGQLYRWPVPEGHAVYSVAFNAAGDTLAIGSGLSGPPAGRLSLWKVGSQRPPWTDSKEHKQPINEVAFSGDGNWLASASDDQSVVLWSFDGSMLARVHRIEHKSVAQTVAFSRDSTLLAVGLFNGDVLLYAVASPERTPRELKGHSLSVSALAFNPRGDTIASGSRDTTIRLWPLPANGDEAIGDSVVLRGHTGWVNDLAFSSQGDRLYSASNDKRVFAWDPAVGPEIPAVRVKGTSITEIAFTSQGRLAVTGDECVVAIDPAPPHAQERLRDSAVAALSVSPDGRTLAGFRDNEIWTWTVGSGSRSYLVRGEGPAWGTKALFLHDGNLLAGTPSTLLRLNLATGESRTQMAPQDCELLRPWGAGGSVHRALWAIPLGGLGLQDFRRGDKAPRPLNLGAQSQQLARPSGTRDGRFAVILDAHATEAVVYDMHAAKPRAWLAGHQQKIEAAAFHPTDGSRLATVARDGTLRIWHWPREDELAQFRHPGGAGGVFTAVAWSLDGKTIATGSDDGTIHFWKSK